MGISLSCRRHRCVRTPSSCNAFAGLKMIRVYGSSESVHVASKMEEVDAVEMRLFQDSLSLDLQVHDRGHRPQRTPLFCL